MNKIGFKTKAEKRQETLPVLWQQQAKAMPEGKQAVLVAAFELLYEWFERKEGTTALMAHELEHLRFTYRKL